MTARPCQHRHRQHRHRQHRDRQQHHHPTRHQPRRRFVALLSLLGLLVLTGCGASDDDANGDVAATVTSTTDGSATERSVVTADPEGSATTARPTTSIVPTTEADEDADATIEPTTTIDDPLEVSTRLAPERDDQGIAFTFDRSTVTPLSHSGPGDATDLGADEDLINVIALPSGGYAFQTTDDLTIWLWSGSGPEPLLVVSENERLVLEGAGVDETGADIVFYQRWIYGDPESTVAVLVSHRLSDDTVIEIAPTGGWESGASFTTVSSLGVDNGDTAVASWGAEGFTWLEILDVRTGDIVFDSQELAGECFDGEEGCPWFEVAVPFADDIVGLAPVWNEDKGWVDAFGLWTYDTTTGELDVMQSWPWDNGTWYAEDMFLDGSVLVLSLQDEPFQGAPLPPLYFDLVSGESWTLPEPAFVRPAYLS